MTIDQLRKDRTAMAALSNFYKSEAFKDIRISFVSHTPKGDPNSETSMKSAENLYLGIRYVFNMIEQIVTTPPPPEPKKRTEGGPDPDLAT